LFWRHLFPINRRGDGDMVPLVILNPTIRKKLYEIIFGCLKSDLSAFVHMIDTLNGLAPFYAEEPDKTLRKMIQCLVPVTDLLFDSYR
jgi:hypothetical protein